MTDPAPPERFRSTPAEEVFADWIARRSGGESVDIEDLCRRHPEIRADLERMHAGWRRLSPMLAIADPRETLASPLPPLADDTLSSSPSAVDPMPALADFLAALAGREASFRRYRMEGEVARGGMGVILRAFDRDVGRPLAMKVVRGPGRAEPTVASTPAEPRVLARFLEEARVTGQLDHPGIVPVHELGLDDHGRLYFTMRLVQGRDLAQIFELVGQAREGWSETRALGAILKACEALSYAHARGVIHRDVKPSNIMVGRFGEVYVMDWGLARVQAHEDSDDIRVQALPSEPDAERISPLVTMDGDVLGTASYMSPEQARGELDAIGPHSDVYSVGAILYHLLSGQAPYVPRGSRLGPHAVWQLARAGPPAPLHEVAPSKPPELVAICEKAMAREPGQRYRDVQDLAEDLRSFLENRVVVAYETGAWAEARKWVGRNRSLAASLAAGLLALAAGLVASLSLKAKADSNAALAEAHERTAQAEEAIANREKANVFRLSSFQTLDDLEKEADRLWPADPGNIEKYRTWMRAAEELVAEIPEHRAALKAIEGRVLPLADEDRWWHTELEKLIASLSAFADEKTGLMNGISPDHGWGIGVRLAFATTIEARSVHGPEAARRWAEAIASIAASPKYGGLRMDSQLGLLPLGPDPASGLWEFSHLATAEDFEPAERAADGKLVLKEGMGIVLVLIPGGTFTMGAQNTDPTGSNYDPQAQDAESPLQSVTLTPYFLSKYEMTQGQWLRIVGLNPSSYTEATIDGSWNRAGEPPSLLLPVEQVDWIRSTETCARSGLVLPTEAQWERACRAGTDTPFSSGGNDASLRLVANVADAWAKNHGGEGWTSAEAWDDGYAVHARIGSFAANAFGLHDMHGNVWEWCRDGRDDYALLCSPGDGERQTTRARDRVIRGGGFNDAANFARSAHRGGNTPEQRYHDLGLRPARAITARGITGR